MDRKLVALLVAAIAVPAIGLLALWIAMHGARDSGAIALAILWPAGAGGITAATWAAHAWLLRAKPWAATTAVLVVCFPAAVASMACLYSGLIVAGWI